MSSTPEEVSETASAFRAQVSRFFGEDSPLQRAPDFGGRPYEFRPQQLAMAETISTCLTRGKHLFAEAPTGVGKSFAYLVPAIYLARQTGKPVVISTHTIALQEQLIDKDLPLLQQLLDIPFTAALAKGRENYLCLTRLKKVNAEGQDFLPNLELLPEIAKIAKWAGRTEDGSRHDLDFNPTRQTWSAVCSDADVCPCNGSTAEQQCFFMKARRRLYTADIIVANHALLCADFARRRDSADKQGILPDYAALVIDEAHTFEEVAATHLGVRVSSYAVLTMLNRLYSPKRRRGLLAKPECESVRGTAIRTTQQADRFFRRLRQWLEDQQENPLTYTHAGHVPNQLAEPLMNLADELRRLARQPELDKDVKRELKGVFSRLEQLRTNMDTFLDMGLPESVYWFERYGRSNQYVSMNVVPVEVGQVLRDLLFNQDFPVIMTSATMAVHGRLDYFEQRLGCPEAESLILDSPFTYTEQVTLYLPFSDIPDPRDDENFLEACCHHIREFVTQTNGKAFVLFTNYTMMTTAAEILIDFFETNHINLMVQGQNLQRSQMLEAFREDINSVIFGTSSFWMGVDVPGEALSNVIITRLPFPVPSHPMVKAICERLEQRGRNSFRDYSLPEAVLRFRQGFGRLIRSRDDTGIVVVIDPRITRKSYGNVFLQSIPECRRQVF